MGKLWPTCSLVFTHFVVSCGVWGCGWEQEDAPASCAGGDRSVFGSSCPWNLFTVLWRCCLLMCDFHTFPCALKVKKSLYITVWDNWEHMGKSLGEILFVVTNRPLSQPFLGVWKAVRQLQELDVFERWITPCVIWPSAFLNLTGECWLLGHSSSWVNKS